MDGVTSGEKFEQKEEKEGVGGWRSSFPLLSSSTIFLRREEKEEEREEIQKAF